MGGRGSSYNRSVIPPTPVMVAAVDDDDDQDDQQQQQLHRSLVKGSANTPSGYTLDDFKQMSDMQMSDLVDWADTQMSLPNGLHDDPTQRLIYALGIDKPMENIGGRALQKYVDAGATVLYRGLNDSTYNGALTDADTVADSIRSGNQFNTGGWHGQVHGGGMYMTDEYSGTKWYGTKHVIGAVFNSKANHIDGYSLISKADAWLKSHPSMKWKLAKIAGVSTSASASVLLNANQYKARSVAALAMGYTSISDDVGGGENYYMILDRSTLSTSTYNHRRAMRKSKP